MPLNCSDVTACFPTPPAGSWGFPIFDGEHWTYIVPTGPGQVLVTNSNGHLVFVNQNALACGVNAPTPAPDPGGFDAAAIMDAIGEVRGLLEEVLAAVAKKPKKAKA